MGKLWLWVALFLVLKHQEGAAYKLVCYFTNWAPGRPDSASIFPRDLDPFLCTHMIFAFASMSNYRIVAETPQDEKILYPQFNKLKERNRELKTLLSIGGWNFGTLRFTTMLYTFGSREKFINSVISFLRTHDFDGLDLFFLYPGLRNSPMHDRWNFLFLIEELLIAFQKEALLTKRPRLLLSAAVSGAPHIIHTSYNVKLLGRLLDFINVLSYDFHGSWEKFTGHNSPLFSFPEDAKSSAYAMNYWRKLGAPSEKLMMGFPTYGRTFRLLEASHNGLQAVATGPGSPGKYTKQAGILAYYEYGFQHNAEHPMDTRYLMDCNNLVVPAFKTFKSLEDQICSFLQKARKEWIGYQHVPYAYKGKEWVGYDDIRSFHEKAKFVKTEHFGGAMVWTLDMDDVKGAFCESGPFPLLYTLNYLLVQVGREAVAPEVHGQHKNMTAVPEGGVMTLGRETVPLGNHTVAQRGTEVPGAKTMITVDHRSVTTSGTTEALVHFQTETLSKKTIAPNMKSAFPEKVTVPIRKMSVTHNGQTVILQGGNLSSVVVTDKMLSSIQLPRHSDKPVMPPEGNHSYVN